MKVQYIELKAAVAISDFRTLELFTAKCKSCAFLEDKEFDSNVERGIEEEGEGEIHFLLRECAMEPTG